METCTTKGKSLFFRCVRVCVLTLKYHSSHPPPKKNGHHPSRLSARHVHLRASAAQPLFVWSKRAYDAAPVCGRLPTPQPRQDAFGLPTIQRAHVHAFSRASCSNGVREPKLAQRSGQVPVGCAPRVWPPVGRVQAPRRHLYQRTSTRSCPFCACAAHGCALLGASCAQPGGHVCVARRGANRQGRAGAAAPTRVPAPRATGGHGACVRCRVTRSAVAGGSRARRHWK